MPSPVNNGFVSLSEIWWKKPPILRLPPETLDAIFSYASPSDLINLSLVSKTFHVLAAAQLYRSFKHVFTDDDARAGHQPVDRLAGLLDTLTTSDYNYAAYIKEISLDTAHSGDTGERATSEFKYEFTCGKFLNTLLLATIKKITALESFRWNVRLEISPSVFTALGKYQSLQNLHVRLQAGPSLHLTRPKPKSHMSFQFPPPAPPSSHSQYQTHHHHPAPPSGGAIPTYMLHSKTNMGSGGVRLVKRLNVRKNPHGPRNFSEFSSLRSLAVLDMDTLDYVSEVAECISSSSTTLKTLKLSFSEKLALESRKKAITDISDTETVQEEDDDGFIHPLVISAPPLPPGISPPILAHAPTSSDVNVCRERANQEKALARIFGLEKGHVTAEDKRLEQVAEEAVHKADRDIQSSLKSSSGQDIDRIFVENLCTMVRGIANSKSGHASSSKGSRALRKIEKAALMYLESDQTADNFPKGKKKSSSSPQHTHQLPTSTEPTEILGSSAPVPKTFLDGEEIPLPMAADYSAFLINPPPSQLPTSKKCTYPFNGNPIYPPSVGFGMQGPPVKYKSLQNAHPAKADTSVKCAGNIFHNSSCASDASDAASNKPPLKSTQCEIFQHPASLSNPVDKKPDDEFLDLIDIEHPDELSEDGEDQVFLDPMETSAEGHGQEYQSINPRSDGEPKVPQSDERNSDPEVHAGPSRKGKEPIRGFDTTRLTDTRVSSEQLESPLNDDTDGAIHEYIRLHHGISLENLSIYLIPVKPSVLCRAVNISSLKHISLMNVGPQRPFWAMLSKLHKTTALQITSVHTDNVTQSFLTFLNGLEYLEELIMVERSSRSKVESFAPKTVVVIDDIRRQVLVKHIKHLKRLMIRNDDLVHWCLNRESAVLIGKRGAKLRELVVGMNSSNFHVFMQHLSGLRSLHALHIIFSHSDYCTSLLREIRLCATDNVIQRPHLKVKYVAVSYSSNGPISTSIARLYRLPPMPSKIGKKNTFSQKHDFASTSCSSIAADKGKGKAVQRPESQFSNFITPWAALESDMESDDDDRNRVTVIEGIKFREVTDVKVWQKEIWDLKL
ncbi:uncharacterized protein PADG_06689 [Paracoccidioides brasiliensis Pb18]|uniref:F-box domain-containing protein n=1 Tax=Paracoccidioides brasiliensis (strain Pb18) TaxID=502780 RepID=C1GHF3_PARBD|nr:uncharacterized protein PADG_06689 [Paracoccidioides brasiliensis Pb18]EEH50610.2 hypothetical protein PADG_06689 [Paracoccidioides brasiliensis Pb18]